MTDYFDHVERSLRQAVRERKHLPWHARLLTRRSRPAMLVAVVLLGGGTALAATGVLRTGASVSSEVQPTPFAAEGTVIASSVHVLPIRVADPEGGPPWGLRAARTSRGLLCIQVGRVVAGRVGVLGEDGAFRDDGAFHPFSMGYISGLGCATEDGRGDAFINYELHGIPASGLLDNRRDVSGGCYSASTRPRTCPPSELREVYFGMLGPDATTITAQTAHGGTTVVPTDAPYGAYLVVLPHTEHRCRPGMLFCSPGGYTFSPTLPINEAITAVGYRNAPPCRLPDPEEILQRRHRDELRLREKLRITRPDIYARIYRNGRPFPSGIGALSPHQIAQLETLRVPIRFREPSCPAVGFVARGPQSELTTSQLASPVTAHLVRARRYCERSETLISCGHSVPRGYKPVATGGPPEVLLVVNFTARQAVTSFDSHYEIETSVPQDPRHPGFQEGCGGTFGPTQTNLRAGQNVNYRTFLNARCHGITHVTVAYVTVNGPSGAMPVPGLAGQSAPIPVGKTTITLP
jgi:hypothetical protein